MLTAFLMTGCSVQKDIGKMILARVAAVDKIGDHNIKLTIESEKTTAAPSSKGEIQKRPFILFSEGSTVFDADRNFSAYAEKSIFWGHAKYIIFGESAAQDDIRKYLDFFVRNHENRLNAIPIVAEGQSGEELVNSSGEDLVATRLESLLENAEDMSVSKKITLIEFVEALDSKYSAAFIPCIRIIENSDSAGDTDSDKDIALNGYAVFKGTRLQGYIKNKEARGLNWITGDVKSGIIIVKDKEGKEISLEIIAAKSKITTKLTDGVPNVTIDIKVTSNIGEMQGTADVFKREALSGLEQQQSDIIKDEINSVLEFARKNNADIFGFGEKLYHQHPIQWEGIKNQWTELFPKTKVSVEIDSNISGVYNIIKPVRSWEGAS
jgi:spore germination protein KC